MTIALPGSHTFSFSSLVTADPMDNKTKDEVLNCLRGVLYLYCVSVGMHGPLEARQPIFVIFFVVLLPALAFLLFLFMLIPCS